MAFSKLPEDVMAQILKNLDSVQDISNLFEAFPEINGLIQPIFNSKRNNWIFSLILPHILPWLEKKDILNSRQVCKQWTSSVDHLLENHPSRKVYDPEAQPQPWLPILKTPSTHYPPLWAYQNKFQNDWKTGTGIRFDTVTKVEGFLVGLLECNYPQGRNPFIGRSVTISDYLWKRCSAHPPTRDSEVSMCWHMMIMNIFQQYGAHIWFLDIARLDVDSLNETERRNRHSRVLEFGKEIQDLDPMGFSKLVLDSIQHLSNLKSLQLKYKRAAFDPTKEGEFDVPVMPSLPHLETLGVPSSDLPDSLVDILVMSYSSQLKSLSINGKFWREGYPKIFPSLIEFQVLDGASGYKNINNILSSMKAPQLRKLQLSLADPKFVVEESIPNWLMQFPRLESLTLDIGHYSCHLNTFHDLQLGLRLWPITVDSLKHLWMNNYAGGMDRLLEFLGKFPSLESLTIYPKSGYSRCFKHENMYEPTLWELLPKLKKITVLGTRDIGNQPVPKKKTITMSELKDIGKQRVPNRVYYRPLNYI